MLPDWRKSAVEHDHQRGLAFLLRLLGVPGRGVVEGSGLGHAEDPRLHVGRALQRLRRALDSDVPAASSCSRATFARLSALMRASSIADAVCLAASSFFTSLSHPLTYIHCATVRSGTPTFFAISAMADPAMNMSLATARFSASAYPGYHSATALSAEAGSPVMSAATDLSTASRLATTDSSVGTGGS